MSPGLAVISEGVKTRDLLRVGEPTTTAMILEVLAADVGAEPVTVEVEVEARAERKGLARSIKR